METTIGFQLAKLAKEKGFDEKCKKWFTDDKKVNDLGAWTWNTNYGNRRDFVATAPTQSELQTWLRNKYDIFVLPFIQFENAIEDECKEELIWICYVFDLKTMREQRFNILPYLGEGTHLFIVNEKKTFEKAFEEGLTEAIKLLPNYTK
jgi:hypothetical protein